jgi:hypothetical protein
MARYHPHPSIRPSPESLKALPTLRVLTSDTDGEVTRRYCRARGCSFQLELKWETETTRFWLITHCVGEPFPGWEEGKVFVDGLELNHTAERDGLPYGSADLKRLQRLDYIAMLRGELDNLLDDKWSWDRDKRIRELRTELYKVMGVPKFKFKEFEDGSIAVGESNSPAGDVGQSQEE